ncbi:glycosyl transferase [Rheinheimera sediminis]|nr:glycosyl transferase [Rheinheimera sp. YQF-1]
MSIPKVIHYVWVGHAPKSELVLRCIASWKKFLPDYDIIEWNNQALAHIQHPYVQQAFAAEKWAFVSDYLRLYALYSMGGFYFDADLEVTADLEPFRTHQFVSGYEVYRGRPSPVTALMGAQKGSSLIAQLLDLYREKSFVQPDGGLDLTPNTKLISQFFATKFGLTKPYQYDQRSELCEGCWIYPSHYFCTPVAGKASFSIHHFNGSWMAEYSRKVLAKISGYQLLKLKRNKVRSGDLPLLQGEQRMLHLGVTARYSLLLVKLQNS